VQELNTVALDQIEMKSRTVERDRENLINWIPENRDYREGCEKEVAE
jgi:hypothetical protein